MLAIRSLCSKPYSFNRMQKCLNDLTFNKIGNRPISMGNYPRLVRIQDLVLGILGWSVLAMTFVGTAYKAGVIEVTKVEAKQENLQTEEIQPASPQKFTQEELFQRNRGLLFCLFIVAIVAKILQGED